MKLLPIQRNQFPQWNEMRKALYTILDNEDYEQEMQQISDSNEYFSYFVIDNSNQILGLVELSSRNIVDGCLSSPVAYLEGLYLKEEYRGRGIGKKVIRMILKWCKERGFSELATDTELTNVKAQNFYKTVGFEETDRVVEFRIEVN